MCVAAELYDDVQQREPEKSRWNLVKRETEHELLCSCMTDAAAHMQSEEEIYMYLCEICIYIYVILPSVAETEPRCAAASERAGGEPGERQRDSDKIVPVAGGQCRMQMLCFMRLYMRERERSLSAYMQ